MRAEYPTGMGVFGSGSARNPPVGGSTVNRFIFTFTTGAVFVMGGSHRPTVHGVGVGTGIGVGVGT